MSISKVVAASESSLPRDAHLYWIHCNRCYELYIRRQRSFFILACHHITCENCTPQQHAPTPQGAPSFKCPICGKKVRGRQLGNIMPPHIKELFHPQYWLDDLPTSRILRFQQEHRRHFFQGIVKLRRVYIKLQKNLELVRVGAKKKFQEIENFQRERKHLERRVRSVIEKRKLFDREREQGKTLQMLHSQAPSTTDESGISTGNIFHGSRIRHRPQSVGAGRGTYISGPKPRKIINPHSSDVTSFVQKHNSFTL